jgi:AAA domain
VTVQLTSAPGTEPRQPVVLPDPAFPVPRGELIPLRLDQVPGYVFLDDFRKYELPDRPEVVPQIIYAGVNLLVARPGAGKTVLAVQLGQCVSLLEPFAGYAPETPGRVLALDFENGIPHTAEISRRHVPYMKARTGDDGTDRARRFEWDTEPPGAAFPARANDLEARLSAARDADAPYSMVIIDAMTSFFGPYPQHTPRDQHEGACMRRLDRMGLDYGCAVVLIAHTNKAGDVAGSRQIEGGLTTAYMIERDAESDEGKLICLKNRAAPERSWPMKFVGGIWEVSQPITRAQAENSGTKRLILDWLAEHGPAQVEAIRENLPGVKPKTVSDLLYRLRRSRFVAHSSDGLWAIQLRPGEVAAEPDSGWGPGTIGEAANPPQIGECAGCHGSMRIIAEGQRTHPDPACEAAAAEAERAAAGPLTEQPELTGRGPAGLADDDGHQDQGDEEARECPDCHDLITGADSHPDCRPGDEAPPKWGEAFTLMRTTLEKSRMRPVAWIPPAGHAATARVKQNRDMPQWRAAEEADHCAEAGFRWTRPGLLEEFGPDRLVVSFDESQFFPSSCSGVRLAANVLTDHGPLDCNPRLLGDPDPHKQGGGVTGLAGVVRIIAPQWPHSGMPHPMGRRAVPGEPGWWPSGLLEELWKLHEQGLIAPPEVTGSYLGRRSNGLFDTYARGVGEARKAHQADPGMTAAVKRSSSIVLRMLYCQIRSPWWRPDWRAAVVGEGSYRHWVKGWRSSQAGEVIAGMGNVDAVSFLVPQDADPDVYVPTGYEAGREPGTIHPGVIRVRADQCDLSGIDPARIAPSGHPRFAEISGPVPLHVWVIRRA